MTVPCSSNISWWVKSEMHSQYLLWCGHVPVTLDFFMMLVNLVTELFSWSCLLSNLLHVFVNFVCNESCSCIFRYSYVQLSMLQDGSTLFCHLYIAHTVTRQFRCNSHYYITLHFTTRCYQSAVMPLYVVCWSGTVFRPVLRVFLLWFIIAETLAGLAWKLFRSNIVTRSWHLFLF